MRHPVSHGPDEADPVNAADAVGADVTGTDVFGTAALRSATLQGWAASPTRRTEDLAAERDLVVVGYRDRLFTELVANAADAALAAGTDGEVAIWQDGDELHVANTGEPLSAAGVRSLMALRVSAKSTADQDDQTGGSSSAGIVGRFGVGFTATATVARRVEIRSASGSIAFDRTDAAAAVEASGAAESPDVPLLRLAWPVAQTPRNGYATEVVLSRDAQLIDADEWSGLLASAADEAVDLLLDLPSLSRITVSERSFRLERREIPDSDSDSALSEMVVIEVSPDRPSGVEVRWLQAARGRTRWLIALRDGSPGIVPGRADVLRAPTPTDIPLSLPCRCITDLPLTSDRRHLHPDADIATAAVGYVDMVRGVDPADRALLVPQPSRALGRDDLRLIEAVTESLRTESWLPAADGSQLIPGRASVVVGLTDPLAEVLGDLFGDLVHPDLSAVRDLATLERLGASELSVAALAERLVGVERPPQWWFRCYEQLLPLVGAGLDIGELAAIPVPRADGRMNIGVRGLFSAGSVRSVMRWIPTVHPDADHPLLERLGLERLSVPQALADPALQALVDRAADDAADGLSAEEGEFDGLADEVIGALSADPDAAVPTWLARLPLPDENGDQVSADELLLRDGPLASVLIDDHPFGYVANQLVTSAGPDVLRRIGVGWGFMTVIDDLPVAPDHELPDEEEWWSTLPEPPQTLVAVRDLDLVDPGRWPEALTLLVSDPVLAPLLEDGRGYTAWWLRHFAEVDGGLLGEYRAPSDGTLAGVLDALEHPRADELSGALASSTPRDVGEADLLLGRLADPGSVVEPGVAVAVHAHIVAAIADGVLDDADVAVPAAVRTVAGTASSDAMVVDHPWIMQVLSDDEAVLAGSGIMADEARVLARVLDIPLASAELTASVSDAGTPVVSSSAEAVRFAAQWGLGVGDAMVWLHDELWVDVRRGDRWWQVRARWWVDEAGATHLERGTRIRRQ